MTSKWLRPTLGGEQGGREEASGSLQQTGNLLCSRVRPFKITTLSSFLRDLLPLPVKWMKFVCYNYSDVTLFLDIPGHRDGWKSVNEPAALTSARPATSRLTGGNDRVPVTSDAGAVKGVSPFTFCLFCLTYSLKTNDIYFAGRKAANLEFAWLTGD